MLKVMILINKLVLIQFKVVILYKQKIWNMINLNIMLNLIFVLLIKTH